MADTDRGMLMRIMMACAIITTVNAADMETDIIVITAVIIMVVKVWVTEVTAADKT